MPDFTKSKADVKLNVAHLKREKHLIDLEEREEAKKLSDMEMGLKDASEFNRWQREMEQKDDIEKIEHIQKKKIEMELSRQQAIFAKEQTERDNHDLVGKMKSVFDKQMEKREADEEDNLQKRKVVIKQVQEHKGAIVEARTAKVDANREIRD